MKVALAQINPRVGDIEGNTARIVGRIRVAREAQADLVLFPELAVFGYPPRDLVLRSALVRRNIAATEQIARECLGITAVVGYVQLDDSGSGKGVFNAAAVCQDGRVAASYAKMLLPTYGVFDESRYFTPGNHVGTVEVPAGGRSMRVGITVCEDLWNDHQFEGRRVYGVDPIAMTAAAGVDLIVNISASPFEAGRQDYRELLFAEQIRDVGVALVQVNQVGGQDDLIFDGASVVLDPSGHVVARAKAFGEDLLYVDTESLSGARVEPYPDRLTSIRQALVMGIRDYMHRCGFERAVVGLSGGIDSAVTAALAVEAVGGDRLLGVAMPSRFSSSESLADARELASKLKCAFEVVPIEGAHHAMEVTLRGRFRGFPPDTTEENVQARIRGMILMAISNKFGWLVLSTGNKSELAVGYCTLYGDMCGGLAVLSDVPKTMVYQLARLMNESADGPRIPLRTIEREPTAELREDQRDSDSLPPYEILDAILELYIERDRAVEEIVAAGFDRATVEKVTRMVDGNEYKRKQAPVGLRVTSRAFGPGWRMPITAKYS